MLNRSRNNRGNEAQTQKAEERLDTIAISGTFRLTFFASNE